MAALHNKGTSSDKSKYFGANRGDKVTDYQSSKRPHCKASVEEIQIVLAELEEIKNDVKETIKKCDLTEIVSNIVENLLENVKADIKTMLAGVESKLEKKLQKLD